MGLHGPRAWRLLAATLAMIVAAAACNGAGTGGDPPGDGSTEVSGDEHCAEAGFVDGEQRNEAGELIAECRPGPTPSGGAYSIARYSDADGAADKDEATTAEITEYDENGNVINTTHGTLGGG